MAASAEANRLPVVVVVDNCRLPAKSLLQRLRFREMMELSALRWDSTPSSLSGYSAHGSISDNLAVASSPSPSTTARKTVGQNNAAANSTSTSTSPTYNLGPKVPRRQVSPPAVKRDTPQQKASSVVPASSSNKSSGRPNLPVRTKSPMVQPRHPLDDSEQEHGQDLQENAKPEPPLSPLVRSRHQHHYHRGSDYNINTEPRIPKRKSSLIAAARDEAGIHRILQQEEGSLSSSSVSESGGKHQDAVTDRSTSREAQMGVSQSQEQQKVRQLTRRPSLPRRQSSFERLPATMPTRQSSFEIRHRAKASPSLGQLDSGIIEEVPQSTWCRSTAATSQGRRLQSSRVIKDDVNDDVRLSASLPTGVDEPFDEHREEMEQGQPVTTNENIKESEWLPSPVVVKRIAPSRHSPSTAADFDCATGMGICPHATKDQCPSTPRSDRDLKLPQQQTTPTSNSSSDSGKLSNGPHRFRRFRGGSRPSLPVRTSSFDMSMLRRGKDIVRVLPGRKASFPDLRSTF